MSGHTVYRPVSGGSKLHWPNDDPDWMGMVSACAAIPLAKASGQTAGRVPATERCAGSGCRQRWSAIPPPATDEWETPVADTHATDDEPTLPPIMWWSADLADRRRHDDEFAPGLITEAGRLYFLAADAGWEVLGELPTDARRLVVDTAALSDDTAARTRMAGSPTTASASHTGLSRPPYRSVTRSTPGLKASRSTAT